MSKYQDCAIFVDGNDRYCCRPKVMRVTTCAWCIINANGGDIPILVFPTGDVNDEPIDSGLVAGEGLTVLDKSGVYKLDIDCDALDGTDAPKTGAITVCCEPNLAEDFDSKLLQKLCDIADGQTSTGTGNAEILLAIQACLAEMKLLVAANNNTTILVTLETQLMAICEKMLASGESLEAICKKLEQGFGDMVDCLKKIKEYTQCLPDIKALLECLPGYGDQCFFNTYATADYNVDAVLIGADDVSAKVGAPFDGNNAPAHNIFKEALTACLRDDYGYEVTFTQGRDGFQLKYFGLPINLSTS